MALNNIDSFEISWTDRLGSALLMNPLFVFALLSTIVAVEVYEKWTPVSALAAIVGLAAAWAFANKGEEVFTGRRRFTNH